jgi:hypothetical protein
MSDTFSGKKSTNKPMIKAILRISDKLIDN